MITEGALLFEEGCEGLEAVNQVEQRQGKQHKHLIENEHTGHGTLQRGGGHQSVRAVWDLIAKMPKKLGKGARTLS